MDERFQVEYSEEAFEFLNSLTEKERDKVLYNISKAIRINDQDLFKKLTDEIWEFRTLANKKQIRLLAFWDKSNNRNTIVIACNGFIKKTQKTPYSELEKAKKIRDDYFSL